MIDRNRKEKLMKGELKCDFITDNLDEVTNFWNGKKLGQVDPSEPIPTFRFTTSQQIEDGYYWFVINGYKFTNCWVEVAGWTENVHCITGSYYLEKL